MQLADCLQFGEREREGGREGAGADPGGVRWVRTNPPSSLQYQLLLRAELILGCKHSKKSGELNRRWLADARPCDGCNAVSVIIDGRVQNVKFPDRKLLA